jgi:hypothetical protein
MTRAGTPAPWAVVLAMLASLVTSCMKDRNPQIAELVSNIETVEQWSRGSAAKEHVEWLRRSVAWDIVAVVKMTLAAGDADQDRIDELLRSGLAEAAAGPGDYVVPLVNEWRRSVGGGPCKTTAPSDDDLRWLRERLTLPAPKGAGPESRKALDSYARRATETRDVVRVDCGGPGHLLVGVLDGRLVVVVRE